MFFKASLVTLVGALAVSALDLRSVHTILQRQLSPSDVPVACQSTCQSTITILNACLNGDQTCLSVCQPGALSEVTTCFQCVLDQAPGVTQSDVDQANETVGELQSLCASAGQTISAASLTAASGAATASSGGASASDVSASITDASFTSASGGLTIGGGAASGASTSGVAITSSASSSGAAAASTSSSASRTATSAASATPSSAASVSAKLPNFAAMALSLGGVGAGAVFVL